MSFYIQDRELEPPEILENECIYCGDKSKDNFCSKQCRIAHEND